MTFTDLDIAIFPRKPDEYGYKTHDDAVHSENDASLDPVQRQDTRTSVCARTTSWSARLTDERQIVDVLFPLPEVNMDTVRVSSGRGVSE